MPLIVATERKHWTTRVLIAGMYLLATVGALTMVYPFLLMVSGSLKCRLDFDDFEVVPSYFSDTTVLYRKYLFARYNENAWRFQFSAKSTIEDFADIPYPARVSETAARDLHEFLSARDYPEDYITLAQRSGNGVQPRMERKWRSFLYRRFHGDLQDLNREMAATFKGWETVAVPEMNMLDRSNRHGREPFETLYRREFRPSVPVRDFFPIHVEGLFFTDLNNRYGRDVRRLNDARGTAVRDFREVPLPRRYPRQSAFAPDWETFVREDINLVFLRLPPEAATAYRAFQGGRYATVQAYNRAYGTRLSSFEHIPMPPKCPEQGAGRRDWQAFIESGDCLPWVEIDSLDFRYRDFLKAKYGSLARLNAAHTAAYESFETAPLRLAEYDAWLVNRHRGEIVREFAVRNYAQAAEYLALRGRAFWNTFRYVGLNVLLHLIVNPMAAYALSRYRMRYTHWILVFCLLTMAFPAEVGSIPRFLLIRELGLLNTLWALVLPGAAHGFSIFILKGFFDGLPRELYEAAVIEGASERWMYWNVTLALTKPILAVTAFGAFTAAYGAFLFALIICPDERMWTISVWLYQFQQSVSQPVAFAGLVLASLPVFVAFIIAQKFILRGIVLPVEK